MAELVADGKALGPLLELSKATEVGGREGTRERESGSGRDKMTMRAKVC